MANSKPTAQTGALTLVLLVKQYRSQMIALLLKNGVVAKNNASDQEIAMLMANLLKVSKSYFNDLNKFIMNPSVTQVVVGQINQVAKYSNMSGGGYMNYEGEDNYDYGSSDYTDTTDYNTPTDSNNSDTSNQDAMMQDLNNMDSGDPVIDNAPIDNSTSGSGSNSGGTKTSGGGFFTNLNIGDIIKGGFNLFGQYTKSQSDAEIARQHALVEQAKADAIKAGNATYIDPKTGKKLNVKEKPSAGMSTTTKVFIGLGVIAVLGFGVYFAMKASKK